MNPPRMPVRTANLHSATKYSNDSQQNADITKSLKG